MSGRIATRLCVACAVMATFTACGGSGSIANTSAAGDARGKSWIAQQAASGDLLYISRYEDESIGVYAYPSLKAVGTINNTGSLGLCTDAGGDVFADGGGEIYEYQHGGTSPIATLSDGTRYAWACSVDPTTGNLAVVSIDAASGWYGDVAIYKRARGSPKRYKNRAFKGYFGCGYDPLGNLYITGFGRNSSAPNLFAELPSGGHALKMITLSHAPEGQGDVQWDGEYVAVSSPRENEIIQFRIKGAIGKEMGSTSLGSAAGDVEQFSFPTIYRSHGEVTQIVGTSFAFGTFMAWNYPVGGAPIKTLNSNYGEALGAVVSVAHRH